MIKQSGGVGVAILMAGELLPGDWGARATTSEVAE